jgi:hypothetical protein
MLVLTNQAWSGYDADIVEFDAVRRDLEKTVICLRDKRLRSVHDYVLALPMTVQYSGTPVDAGEGNHGCTRINTDYLWCVVALSAPLLGVKTPPQIRNAAA